MELKSYAHSTLAKIPTERTALGKIWNSYHYSDSVERTLNELVDADLVSIEHKGRATYITRLVDMSAVARAPYLPLVKTGA